MVAQSINSADESGFFWQIYNEARDPILLFKNDRFLDCNQAALAQLGLRDKAEIRHLTLASISPPLQVDGRASVEKIAEMSGLITQAGYHRFEWRCKRTDGSLFDVEVTATAVSINGEPVIHAHWRDISEQKRLAQQVHESEEAARKIFDEAADPVILFKQSVAVDCNKAVLQQLGYHRKEDLLGLTPRDLSPPLQEGGVPTADRQAAVTAAAQFDGTNSFEWLLKHTDGSIIETETTLTTIMVQGEEVRHMRWRDISEQKRLARELHETEEAARKIFDEAADPVMLYKQGLSIDCNKAALQQLGYRRKEDLLGLAPADIGPPFQENGQPSADYAAAVIVAALRDGKTSFGWLFKHTDGSIIEAEITLTAITVHGEEVLHISWRDIGEQKRLRAALYAEKERAEITLASIGDAVITTDPEGRVTFVNHVASKLTGWDPNEAINKPASEVFHIINETSRAQVISPIDEVLQKGKTVNLANHTVLIARDGKEYNIEDSAAPIFLHDGALLGCVLVFHDVSEKHQLLKSVRWQAGHDPLTGLPNRVLLADRFQRALANARRQKNLLGVCLVDLDQFKPVNDTYGHNTGDLLLVEVTDRMNQAVRSEDTIARLGGDEFVLLLGGLDDIEQLELVLQRILESVSAPYLIGENLIGISASIGVAIYPFDEADADTLLRHADQAMYLAKQAGRNRFHWFDIAHDRQTQTSQQMLSRIREALQGNELCLYYQPKVNMRSGEVVGMEALLRWLHPEKGVVPPLDFLPLAEQTDLIIEIGEWVIEQALQQSAAWSAAGKNWPISVNIAARHFQLPDFFDRLQTILARHPEVPAHQLDIEILESVALGDMQHVQQLILACQALGVEFSLDDFGTGYSSLSYLKRLPADTLKIDQSFVRDMLDDKDDLALVEAIIGLTVAFDRKVVAEGVESIEHGVLLMRLGCDVAQGYGIARPMPAAQVAGWAAHFAPDPKWRQWADIQWHMRDLPLLMAQHDHLVWIKRLLLAVENDASLPLPHDQLTNHHQCRFGLWYDGEGKAHYGHLAEFMAVGPAHAQVHQVGTEIIRLHAAGKIETVQTLRDTLSRLQDQVLEALEALQLAAIGVMAINHSGPHARREAD